MKSVWMRQGNVAIPIGIESVEALRCHKDGSEFIAETRAARNVKQLRMFWALCQILAENDPRNLNKEDAKKNLLWELNYVDIWIDREEKAHVETKSIALESMTQEEFNPFFQSAIDLVSKWLGTARAEVRQRVKEIVDPARGYTIR